MGSEDLREWSRKAWKELEALGKRDAGRGEGDCCRYWRGVRRYLVKMAPYLPARGPADDIRFCPACGRELE